MKEVWKDIAGFEGLYRASTSGKILGVKRNKTLTEERTNGNGYQMVVLHKNAIRHDYSVHQLIALTFLDNPHNKPVVNHKNGIKTDNRSINLEWSTVAENNRHATKNRLNVAGIGEKANASKLSNIQVIVIREAIANGHFLADIARYFKVAVATIGNIKFYRTYPV